MHIKNIKYMLQARDMNRCISFYRDVMGLGVRLQSSHWSEVGFGDTIIAFHAGDVADINDTGLGFQVESITTAIAELRAGGAQIVSGPTDRPEEGIVIAEFIDPEGNRISLSEYYADHEAYDEDND